MLPIKKIKKTLINKKCFTFISCCVLGIVLFKTSSSTECPENILTFRKNNNRLMIIDLWSYASIWAIAKLNSTWRPYAPKSAIDGFKSIFINSCNRLKEFDSLSFKCRCRVYSKHGPLEKSDGQVINFHDVPDKYAMLLFALKTDIKKEFVFKKKFINYADNLIQNGKDYAKIQGLFTDTCVAVFVSPRMRFDRNVYHYYEVSMDWFRKKMKNPLFIILGFTNFNKNDFGIFEKKDVVLGAKAGYGYLLSVIARCNNLIVDTGNLAMFGALFAHGYVHVNNPGLLADINPNFTSWMNHIVKDSYN